MTHFIELTNTENIKFLLNKDWIVRIKPESDGTTIIHVGVPSIHWQNNSASSHYETVHVLELKNDLV